MNWKSIVGSVAPLLGTALGGPLGGVAGKFIADKLGVPEDQLEETIAASKPETLLQLKQIEKDFKLMMKELDIREEQLHAEDRASARQLAKDTSPIPQAIIASVFILGFIVVLYLVFKGEIALEGSMKDAALYLLGILSAGITQILNFYFGSSAGSKQKTALMGNGYAGKTR